MSSKSLFRDLTGPPGLASTESLAPVTHRSWATVSQPTLMSIDRRVLGRGASHEKEIHDAAPEEQLPMNCLTTEHEMIQDLLPRDRIA